MQTGKLLAQRYRLEEKLGEGGMGVVYRAHDVLLDRAVAIKALSPHLIGEEGLKRLLREAQAAAKLTHPNIIAIYDVIDEGDARLIVMEFVAGRTLRERIPLAYKEAVEVARQVCLALDYAHALGVVHRDIKPENIIVAADGTAKVMDFGLARSEGRSRLTQTGMIVGTVAYMAPEQALRGNAEARSDQYALGCVLYEAITGHAPFEADDPIAVITQHINVPPVAPRFHTPAIPSALESVILKLLSKDPENRYRSALEAARALEDLRGVTIRDAEARVKVVGAQLVQAVQRGSLVGRDEETRMLKGLLDAAASGEGRLALIRGQAGIGKTRLVEELLTYAHLRGVRVLAAKCYEGETPYEPITRMLREYLQIAPAEEMRAALGDYATDLARLVPEVRHKLGSVPESISLPPEQERARLFESITRVFATLSKANPLLLFLDDLHLADPATLQLLRYLAPAVVRECLLLVGAYQSEEADRTPAFADLLRQLRRERYAASLEVKPLTQNQVAELIQTMAKLPRPPVRFAGRIFEVTEGNPYFVEEVINALFEQGTLYVKDGQWSTDFDEGARYGEMPIPATVRAAIEARLNRLSDASRQVLTHAAVLGRQFSLDILGRVSGKGDDELLDLLDEALAARMLREVRVASEDRYEFAQSMVREVIYDGLSRHRRRRMHRAAGEALEQTHGEERRERAGELANHFLEAGDETKAVDYSLGAARQSMTLFAYDEAVRYYQIAAELFAELEDTGRLAETSVALGEPLMYLGDLPAAVKAYERGLKFFVDTGRLTEVARVHRLIGRVLQRGYDFSGAIPHLELALRNLSPDEQETDIIQTHLDLARAQTFSGALKEAEVHAAGALSLAETSGTRSLQAAAHASLGLITHHRLDLDGAVEHYAKVVKLAKETNDPEAFFALGRTLNNMAVILEERGNYPEAVHVLQEALELARRVRYSDQIYHVHLHLSAANYLWTGEWPNAKRHLLEILTLRLSPIRHQNAENLLRRMEGDLEAAASLARGLVEDDRRTGNDQDLWTHSAFLAWYSLDLNRIQDAREAADQAARTVEVHPHHLLWPSSHFLVEALARSGDYERCEALCTIGERLGRVTNCPGALSAALFGRAMVALARQKPGEAVSLLEKALPLVESLHLLEAHFRYRLAQALTQRGDRGDSAWASEVMRQCLTLLEQMGDTRKAEQVRAELVSLI